MRRIAFGVLLILLPGIVAGQPSPGAVVINELFYAPAPSSNEFLELYNRSDSAIALHELAFADANQEYVPVSTTDTTLGAGEYVVLVRDAAAFEDAFPSANYLAPDDWAALNNGGDTVYLRHSPSQTVLDSVPYKSDWGGSDGRSLERIDPDGPSGIASNFAPSEADAGATPDRRNSAYDPDESPPTVRQVIPARSGDTLTVVFSEPLDASTVAPAAFHFQAADAPSVVSTSLPASATHRVESTLAAPLSSGNYTLVVSGIADRQGNVLDRAEVSFSYFVPETPAPRDIVVTEILYAPPTSSNEFVELYNRSDKTFDLGAFQIADAQRQFNALAPPMTPLSSGERVVLVRDTAAFTRAFPSIDYFAPPGWEALNNGGDTVRLRHAPSGTEIDVVPYASSWGGSDGRSLERIDPWGPSDHPSNFASSKAAAGATPGVRNSRYARDTVPPRPTFAEQIDSTTAEIVFGEPVQPESITPDAFDLGAISVTESRLRADSIARLSLSGSPTTSSVVVTGVRDLAGNQLPRTTLPFARRPTPGTLVVNEILFEARSDDFDDRPNQVEYVELFSLADHPITLNGLVLTDRPTERGTADTIRAGRRRVLFPGAFAVVAAAPAGATRPQQAQLRRAFPEVPLSSDSVAYLPVDANQLGLRNDGDLVRVHRRDNTIVADVAYAPDWHAAGLAETKGTALARISPTADANAPDNWTSSTAPAGGTPGAPNAVALTPPADAPAAPGLRVRPDPFSIERDGATRIRFTLRTVPNLVRVRIYDARGRKVRTLEEARLTGRSGELVWNGRNDAGHRVRIGPYVVLFEAVRAEEGTVTRLKETVVVARPLN